MELDKDTYDKIVETHQDVKHILKALNHGEKTFRDHSKRIRKLEEEQYTQKGKLTLLITAIGGIVTISFNAVVWAWFKVMGSR